MAARWALTAALPQGSVGVNPFTPSGLLAPLHSGVGRDLRVGLLTPSEEPEDPEGGSSLPNIKQKSGGQWPWGRGVDATRGGAFPRSFAAYSHPGRARPARIHSQVICLSLAGLAPPPRPDTQTKLRFRDPTYREE